MDKKTLFSRLMNYFSYEGQCYLIVGIGMIGVCLLGWSYVEKNLESIRAIDIQLSINQMQKPLRSLLEHLQMHEMLVYRYLNHDDSVVGEMTTLRSKISSDIKSINDQDDEMRKVLAGVVHPVYLKDDYFNVKTLEKTWNEIQALLLEQTIYSHEQLISEIRNIIRLMGDSSVLSQNFSMEMFYSLEMTYSILPEIQAYITNMTMSGEEIIESKEKKSRLINNLIGKVALLEDHIQESREGIGKIYEMDRLNGVNHYVFSVFDQFISKVDDFSKLVQNQIISSEKVVLSLADFLTASSNTYTAVSAYWNASMEQIDSTLEVKKQSIIKETLLRLLMALFFISLGFLLSIYLIRWLSFVLNNLDENIRKFTNGNLTARAQVFFHDQAGQCAIAFNEMAAHYEALVKDLKNMLEVIKKLSSGDFSTRLHVSDPQSETGRVAAPFNQMAKTFGEIVGQLRELGITLATSATQITAASKQQELVITEQESTTREISVTANEISTTAQEFANTMNEVSHVAEETAQLAGTGKKSLQHMEQIMRQMVEAAQSIASKLAVLNEKASNITSVITTITKVADQTNLLSLNASIEAEKAGEYGKSFAVIAKEIRRLADLTANATLDIEKIVTEIMTAVSTSVIGVDDFTHEIKNGTEEVGQVAEQLNTIMEQVQVLSSNFDSINQGMQGQALGAEQINDAIAGLNLTARETSASLSGFRQTLQGLTIAAGDLKSAVDRIKKENLMDRLSIDSPSEVD